MASTGYNPTPSVSPTGPSGATQQINAGPEKFGAQVGQAVEKLGAVGERASAQQFDVALKQQGMINETLATNAETQYVSDLGKITGEYRAKKGLDAVSSLPQTTQDIAALRQRVSETLPNDAARRAFTTLALRHEGYALRDANGYSAQQIKEADLHSAQAASAVAIDRAGAQDVASDDERFKDVLGDITFATQRMMQNQGWGGQMKAGPNGEVSFDDTTDDGRNAKNVYDSTLQAETSKAYVNRYHTLADQNVVTAYDSYKRNRADIPGDAQVHLDSYFQPKIRDAQTRYIADGIMAETDRGYQAAVRGVTGGQASSVADAIHAQESGGKANAPTSANGAVGGWQIKPDTFARYAKPGEDIADPKDNEAVGKRIVADLENKYPDDPARVAVAYFSGEGNVAPKDSPTPYLRDTQDANGKSVSSYVSDVTGRMKPNDTGVPSIPGPVQTKADYYRTNYEKIISDARAKAQTEHPDDPRYADVTVSRVEQRMNQEIRQQELAYKADNDLVYQAFTGDLSNGKKPTSVDDLMNTSPDVKAAWERMQAQNPQAALAVETRILTANAKASDHDLKTYGAGFYKYFTAVHAAPGTEGRITDVSQLYDHVGADGDLTVAGIDKLRGEIAGRGTPEGTAVSEMKKGAMAYAKHQLSFEADYGTFKIPDPKGTDAFNVGFTPAFFKAYEEGIAAGKTPYQLLSKDSPDFIVDKLTAAFKRPKAEEMQDRIAAGLEAKRDGVVIPDVGEIRRGYKFKGGNPALPGSWESVSGAAPSVPVR